MKNFPGPTAWIDRAAAEHGAEPQQLAGVLGIDPFMQFCDLVGQATAQARPDVRDEQIAHAIARLKPLRVALAAAEAILADVEAEIEAEELAQLEAESDAAVEAETANAFGPEFDDSAIELDPAEDSEPAEPETPQPAPRRRRNRKPSEA